jgi:hypothetical protein
MQVAHGDLIDQVTLKHLKITDTLHYIIQRPFTFYQHTPMIRNGTVFSHNPGLYNPADPLYYAVNIINVSRHCHNTMLEMPFL